MAIFDADFESTLLPPWDLKVIWRGVVHPIRQPTARELSRIIDSKDTSDEGACRMQQELFHQLSGIPLAQGNIKGS